MSDRSPAPHSAWAQQQIGECYGGRRAAVATTLTMGVILSLFCAMMCATGGPWELFCTIFTATPAAIACIVAALLYASGTTKIHRVTAEVNRINEVDYALAQALREQVESVAEMVTSGKMIDPPSDDGWQLINLESFRDWNMSGGWSGSFGGLFSRSGGGSWWGTASPDLMDQSVVAHFRRGESRDVVQAILPSAEVVTATCTRCVSQYLAQSHLPEFVRWPSSHTHGQLKPLQDFLSRMGRVLHQVRIANELQLEAASPQHKRTYKLLLQEIRPGQAWLLALTTPEGSTMIASPLNVTDFIEQRILPLLPKPSPENPEWL